MNVRAELKLHAVSILIPSLFYFFRCFVGTEKEQWRSCSVSFVPPSSASSSPSQHIYEGAYSANTFVVSKFPSNKNDHFQSPPRPGGLHGRDLATAASEPRLLPIQFIHHEGPPNATQTNNDIIDCSRDKC